MHVFKDTANVLDVRRVAFFHTVLYISYILEMNGIVGFPPPLNIW